MDSAGDIHSASLAEHPGRLSNINKSAFEQDYSAQSSAYILRPVYNDPPRRMRLPSGLPRVVAERLCRHCIGLNGLLRIRGYADDAARWNCCAEPVPRHPL